MMVKHDKEEYYYIKNDLHRWHIQWFNDDDNYKMWGGDIAFLAGFYQYFEMICKLNDIFGGSIFDGNVHFETKEIAIEAMEWLESKIIINKLSKIS